jgi:DnaJ-class molecular chaperone
MKEYDPKLKNVNSCVKCAGSGKVDSKPCPLCNGAKILSPSIISLKDNGLSENCKLIME